MFEIIFSSHLAFLLIINYITNMSLYSSINPSVTLSVVIYCEDLKIQHDRKDKLWDGDVSKTENFFDSISLKLKWNVVSHSELGTMSASGGEFPSTKLTLVRELREGTLVLH